MNGMSEEAFIVSIAGMKQEIERRQMLISYHLNETKKLVLESIHLKNCKKDMEEVRRKKIASLPIS
jgi:hypothetical protein